MKKALVVGIDYYEHISPLYGCVNDAHSVKSVLERHSDGSVNFHVELLSGTGSSNAVTRTKLRNMVQELFSGDSEIALFYFAGHGHIETTGGYICSSDCEAGNDGLPLREMPDPAALGLNPARTRLGVLTAFFDNHDPVVTPGASDAADGLSDSTLRFDNMTLGGGRAFAIGEDQPVALPLDNTPAAWQNWVTNATKSVAFKGTPTFKRWVKGNGVNYLMEEVPYPRVAAPLSQLPPMTSRLEDGMATNLFAADAFLDALPRRLFSPVTTVASTQTQPMRSGRLDWNQTRSVVLDYVALSGSSSYTFQSNTTYYVSGPCSFGDITLQGGTVIKYINVSSATAYIEVSGTVTCNTSGNYPAIFTAADDNTVGQTISGSTGSPSGYYGYPALYAPGGFNVSNVRISYALQAVRADYSGTSSTLADSQVMGCMVLAVLGNGAADAITLTCNNCLCAAPAYYAFFAWDNGTYTGGDRFYLNHCTVNNALYLVSGTSAPYSVNATNCIFANSSLNMIGSGSKQGGYNGFYSTTSFGSSATTTTTNPFQTSGSDGFYLATNSVLRNAGTTGIGSTLLTDIQTRTTTVPAAGGWPDNDATPDLGWHYPLQDTDNDGLPDWWEQYWFGNLTQNGSTLDASGNTLLTDYANYLAGSTNDPNVISFHLSAANDYVNYTNPTVQLNIAAGLPGKYAVFVGNGTTNWLTYSSTNLTVNLGTTDCVYVVNVGLKGAATNATQSWQSYTFTVDRVAPVLTITNPVINAASNNAVVITPYLQLQGYANEQLAGLSYDISNATGLATNLDAFVTDQGFDTNLFDFTTNYFQAYDVALTNGLNNLTLRVTDRAGNVTATNFNVTLDYSGASNPVMQLTWPTNGMQLCGDSFTLRGLVDDPSASVCASITDTNGDTNLVTGDVERSGVLWLENLPLNSGTNWVMLWATNAAGLGSMTSFFVIQNSMTLTVTEIDGDLWQAPATMRGTISDLTAAIYVNGVQGTNNGDGSWLATNVPVSASGVASFDVSAVPVGGGDPDFNTNVIKDAEIVIVQYHDAKSAFSTNAAYGQYMIYTRTKDYRVQFTNNAAGQQMLTGYKGTATDYTEGLEGYSGGWYQDDYLWTATNKLDHYTDNNGNDITYTGFSDDYQEVTGVPDQDLYELYIPLYIYHYHANNVHEQYVNSNGTVVKMDVDAQTEMKLFTGGKAGVARQNLIQLQCAGTEYDQPSSSANAGLFGDEFAPWVGVAEPDIPKSKLWALGKQVGADGNLWVAEPDGAALDLGLIAKGEDHYNATATVQKYKLRIDVNDSHVLWENNASSYNTFCVGQYLNFSPVWWPSTPPFVDAVAHWTLPGTFVNEDPYAYCLDYYDENTALLNKIFSRDETLSTFCWYVKDFQAQSASVAMNLSFPNGQTANVAAPGQFNVYRPTIETWTPLFFGTTPLVTNYSGYLSVGLSTGHGSINVMSFEHSIQSKFSGTAGYTQLISGEFDTTFSTSTDGYELDNTEWPRDQKTINPTAPEANRFVTFDDSPHVGLPSLTSTAAMDLSFETYLRFIPDAGPGPNIFVTLRLVTWGVTASATKSGGVWTVNPGSSVGGPNDSNSFDFPFWTEIFSNIGL